MCDSCNVFVVPATVVSFCRKHNCPFHSKLKLVPAEISFQAPFLNVTSAPLSIAGRTENRLVGNVGARSTCCNVIFLDAPLESKTVNFAVASLLLWCPSASSMQYLSGSNSSSKQTKCFSLLIIWHVAPQSISNPLLHVLTALAHVRNEISAAPTEDALAIECFLLKDAFYVNLLLTKLAL